MKAIVVIMWNLAAGCVFWTFLLLAWDNRSNGPAFTLGAAAVLAVVGCILNSTLELGL